MLREQTAERLAGGELSVAECDSLRRLRLRLRLVSCRPGGAARRGANKQWASDQQQSCTQKNHHTMMGSDRQLADDEGEARG